MLEMVDVIVILHDFHLFQSFSGSSRKSKGTLHRSAGQRKRMTRSLPTTDAAYLKTRWYYGAAAAHGGNVRSKPPTILRQQL